LKAVFKTPAAAPGSALAAAPATISAAGPGRAGTGLPAAFRAAAADAGLALSAAAGPLARLAQGLATPALPAWAAAAIAGPPGAARGSADTATGPAASARGRAGNIYVQVDNRAGDAVEATASSRGDGLDTIVEIVVERVRSAMSRDFARGTGAAAALEGAYGLRRAPR
jgi:hypothetical protein